MELLKVPQVIVSGNLIISAVTDMRRYIARRKLLNKIKEMYELTVVK